MKDYAADKLNAVVALAKHSPGCLAHTRKSIGQNIVKSFALGKTVSENFGTSAKLGFRHILVFIRKSVDRVEKLCKLFDLALAVGAKYFCYYRHKLFSCNIVGSVKAEA
jgi:hypothetical protein